MRKKICTVCGDTYTATENETFKIKICVGCIALCDNSPQRDFTDLSYLKTKK